MALELFSIVGKLAVTGLKQTQAGMATVKKKVEGVSKSMTGLHAKQKKVSSGFAGMNTSIQGMNTKIQKSSAGLTAAGGILTGLGASIVLLGGAALRTGAEFDSGMRKVAAVSGAAGSEIKALRDIAKELGSTTQFSATQAADAMGFLAQAGFSANEVMGAIPSTLQLASAAQLDLASAADITSNILAGFGLEVSELGRANDVLVKTFTSANTDLVQLGQAMKFVGPVAKAAGVSFEETAAAVGLLGNAGIQACFDKDTEVLTKDGYKRWPDVTEQDVLATVNPKTGELEWQRPTQVYQYDYKGKMYHVKNRHVDLMVTPNHRMWVRRRDHSEFETIEAQHVFGKTVEYQVGGLGWKGDRYKTHTLLGFSQNRGSWKKQVAPLHIPLETWAEFLGYYLSEGSSDYIKGTYRIRITQRKGWVRDAMRACFYKLPLHYREEDDGFTFASEQLYRAVNQFGKSYEKYIPEYAKNWTPNVLEILYEAFRKGDGDQNGTLYTASSRLRDDFEEVILKIGWGVAHRLRPQSEPGFIRGRKIQSTRPQYKILVNKHHLTPAFEQASYKSPVHASRLKGVGTRLFERWEQYDGKVYCASVPNGLLVVRRNGQSIVSGNSMAGTTLRGAITRMLSPSNEAKKVMAKLGLEVQNADGSFVGFKGIVGQLENSVTRLKDPTQFAADAMTLFGQRAGPGLLSLIDQGSEALGDLTAELEAAGGTAERISKVQMEGLRGAFLEFKSALEGVQIAIVESGIGDLFADIIREGAGVLRFFTNINPEILKWGAIIVGAFGAAALVIGPFLLLLPTLSAGFAVVSGAIAGAGGIAAALGALATGVALPVAAVVALIAILVIWRTEIGEVIAGISAWVTETGVVDVAMGGLKIAANAVASFFKDQFGPAIDTVKKAFGFLGDQVAKVVNFFREKGKKAMQEQADAAELLALREEGLAQTTATLHENEKGLFESRKKAKDQTEAISKITDKLRKSLRLLEKAEKTGDRQARKVLKTRIKLQTAERKRLLQGPKVVKALKKETGEVGNLDDGIKDLAKTVDRFVVKSGDAFKDTLKGLKDKIDAVTGAIENKMIAQLNKLSAEFAVLQVGAPLALEAVSQGFRDVQAVIDNEFLPVLEQTIPRVTQDVIDAFDNMGIKTIAELQALATDAETEFNLIRDSGIAGPPQVEKAWIDMLKARKAALIANGTDLTTEEQTTLNTLLAKQKDFKDDSIGEGGPFQEWAAGVSSIVKDLSADLVKGLFTGDLSFGGSFGEKLRTIASSFKSIFVDKASEALSSLVNTGIKALLGGLDNIIAKLTGKGGVGEAFTKVFGSGDKDDVVTTGTNVAGTATNVAGTATKVAGTASSAATSAVSGIAAGPIGLAVMAAGVVSGVIGNFQMAGMNKKLKKIEQNTARTNQALVDRADGGIIGILFRVLWSIDFGTTNKATIVMKDHIAAFLGPIKDWVALTANELTWGFNTKANERSRDILNDTLFAIRDGVQGTKEAVEETTSELIQASRPMLPPVIVNVKVEEPSIPGRARRFRKIEEEPTGPRPVPARGRSRRPPPIPGRGRRAGGEEFEVSSTPTPGRARTGLGAPTKTEPIEVVATVDDVAITDGFTSALDNRRPNLQLSAIAFKLDSLQGVIANTLRVDLLTKMTEGILKNREGQTFIGNIIESFVDVFKETELGFNTKANERTRDILNDNLPRIKDSIENIRPNLSVNVSELVVREEADIDKIAKQLFMMLEQGGGVTSNL